MFIWPWAKLECLAFTWRSHSISEWTLPAFMPCVSWKAACILMAVAPLCPCASRGAGLQAGAGPPEGRGLWRGPVELSKLHLPQPPGAKPLWTVRDATLRLSSRLQSPTRRRATPCLSCPQEARGRPRSLKSAESVETSISVSCQPLLPAEEEPLPLCWPCALSPCPPAGSGCHLLAFCGRTSGDSPASDVSG